MVIDTELLRQILLNTPNYIFWKDKDLIYRGCNYNFAYAVGYDTPEGVIGKSDDEMPWGQYTGKLYQEEDREILSGKKILNKQIPMVVEGEQEKTLSVSKVPLYNKKGEVTGILGIYIDITTEKKIQEELAKQIDETEQANYSTIRFISTASHEIRNPMTNVLALQNGIKEKLDVLQDFFYKMIKLLNDKSETEFSNKIAETFHEMHELAYLCNSEANRTLTALQNLGDLHHMQSEGIKTNFVFIGLDEFIKKSISNSTYPNTKNLEVDIHISETIPKEVIIDYANLCAALSVLIGNAIRFSRINQRIKIEVTTMQQESNSYLTITVQDYGVGMPEEQVKRLFTALNKEGKHTRDALYHKPSVQLLRAKMWIEASGGKLELTSVVNQGTTASITVPYSVADSEKIANFSPKIKKAIESPNSSFQPYILLIEDDNISQKSTYTALIEAGYKVDVASDGAEAIRLALKNDYDVAILDISLPDMNGVEVMHQIRAIKQDQIIFIAFTSHASEEDEDYFIEAGVMAVLAKPATISQLQNLIEEAIKVKIRLNQEKK